MLRQEQARKFKAICKGVWLLNLSEELFLLEFIKVVLSPCVLLSKYFTKRRAVSSQTFADYLAGFLQQFTMPLLLWTRGFQGGKSGLYNV